MTKISFKEKQAIFSALQAAQHAEADVSLLQQKQPSNIKLRAYKKFATMKANEILYDLLEVATREEIIKNRRNFGKSAEQLAKEEAEQIAAEKEAAEKAAKEEADRIAAEKEAAEKAAKEEADRIAAEKEAAEKAAKEEADRIAAEKAAKDVASNLVKDIADYAKEDVDKAAKKQALESLKAEHEELQEDHSALQEEKSDLEDENNELQEEIEEIQEQNAELEDQLEAEKKKEPTPKPVIPKKPVAKASPKKKSTRR